MEGAFSGTLWPIGQVVNKTLQGRAFYENSFEKILARKMRKNCDGPQMEVSLCTVLYTHTNCPLLLITPPPLLTPNPLPQSLENVR